MKATVILDEQQILGNGRYNAIIKVYQVKVSPKFPIGIKAKFVLVDMETGATRLLIDNYEPFGFHIHSELPKGKQHRETLSVTDYKEALIQFLEKARDIADEEQKTWDSF